MNDHFREVRNMISDTPISDSTPHNIADLGMLCRRLERKLAATRHYLSVVSDRVKRMEEAGDALCENSNPSRWDSPEAAALKLTEQSNWNKAKEAKAVKYRKKPVIIEATQWFKNGGHPLDYSKTHNGFENGELRQFSPEHRKQMQWEGDIVRYYRLPGVNGMTKCKHCNRIMHDHGWIDTLEGGHNVCPGDYIITGVKGEHYPCKPDIFRLTYEMVEEAKP